MVIIICPDYLGNLSYTAGLEFDYIIVHETGHEWWGNSVTTNDIRHVDP